DQERRNQKRKADDERDTNEDHDGQVRTEKFAHVVVSVELQPIGPQQQSVRRNATNSRGRSPLRACCNAARVSAAPPMKQVKHWPDSWSRPLGKCLPQRRIVPARWAQPPEPLGSPGKSRQMRPFP